MFSNDVEHSLIFIVNHSKDEQDSNCENDIKINSLSEDEIKEKYNCKICFNEVMKLVIVPCGHMICRLCNIRLMKNQDRCPFCRTAVQLIFEVGG